MASFGWRHRQRARVDYPDGLVSSAPALHQLASSSASAASSWRARWQASTSTSRGEDPGFGRGTVEFINRFSGDPNHPFQPRARSAQRAAVPRPTARPPRHRDRVERRPDRRRLPRPRPDRCEHPRPVRRGSCRRRRSGAGTTAGWPSAEALTLAYLVSEELGGS